MVSYKRLLSRIRLLLGLENRHTHTQTVWFPRLTTPSQTIWLPRLTTPSPTIWLPRLTTPSPSTWLPHLIWLPLPHRSHLACMSHLIFAKQTLKARRRTKRNTACTLLPTFDRVPGDLRLRRHSGDIPVVDGFHFVTNCQHVEPIPKGKCAEK